MISTICGAGLQAQSTDIAIGSATVQPMVKRLGINLGPMATYGSQQIYKNLFAANPGFNNTQYQSVLYCSSGTNASLCVSGSVMWFPAGFWPTDGSVSVRVLTGGGAGCTTTLNSWSTPNFSFSTPCGIAAGDYIAVKKIITPGATGFNPAYGWTTSGSAGAAFAVSSDTPPAVNGTTYTQSLQITAATNKDSAAITAFSDTQYLPWSGTTRAFINLNGPYTVSYWAKAVSGTTPQVAVTLKRGRSVYVSNAADSISNMWRKYTHTFSASEGGVQSDSLMLSFAVNGAASILLDKVDVSEATTSGNPTAFRDDVVATLQALKPGVLRMSDQEGTTNTFDNLMADQWARMPVNFSTVPLNGAPGYFNTISYSVPEFLQLCQTVGAEAWLSLPITLSAAEAGELIDYLSGPTTTTGGALRAAQGFTAPWTTVIPKIHLELGNEEWNGGPGFEGGSMEYNYATYGAYAQSIFAVMKANPNYNASATSLVLSAQFVNSYLLQVVQNACNNNDEIDIAPYTSNTLTDASSIANIWQPALAEPQIFWQTGTASGSSMVCAEYISGVLCPSAGYFMVNGTGTLIYGGGMLADALAEAHSNHPVEISIYEENNSANQGTFSQSQLNAFTSAWGAGLQQASQFLTNMQHGISTQNMYQLGGYYATPIPNPNPSGATYLYLWGSVVDMGGPTNLRRPQFLVEQVINSGISTGASMLTTTQTGTPTYSVGNPSAYPAAGSTVNTVAANAINTIQSFAFNNGSGNYSLVLLNLDTAKSHAVTFSGANAPMGPVNVTTLTSNNLGDTNEVSAQIVPATSTLSSPTGMTLAPYAMYLLTWTRGQSPTLTVSNVAAANLTSTSATINWTTNLASNSLVNYGATSAYGTTSGLNSALVTNHTVTLTGLTPGATYNFDVVSAVSGSTPVTSGNNTFTTTTLPNSNGPSVGYVAAWGITDAGVTVTWSTNVPGTTILAYGTTPALGQMSPVQAALTSSHGVTLSGLLSGTTYYFVAQSTDASGATGKSTTYSFTTGGTAMTAPNPAPVISNVMTSSITTNSATISWTTDQPTTSLVNFGPSASYGSSSPVSAGMAMNHSVTLTGLKPGTMYDFDVVSTNSAGLSATWANSMFVTTAVTSTGSTPTLGYLNTWGVTNSGAIVSWSTNVPATTLLAYGITPALGQMAPADSSLSSSHGIVLTGLKPGTTYYFIAQSADATGATGYSTTYSFTTGNY